MSRTEQAWLTLALKAAGRSAAKQQHGCVLVRGGRVIAVGVNKNLNATQSISPEHVMTKCAIHAEVAALRAAGRSAGAVAYVARINSQGQPVLSAPCPACASALAAAGVRKVIHT